MPNLYGKQHLETEIGLGGKYQHFEEKYLKKWDRVPFEASEFIATSMGIISDSYYYSLALEIYSWNISKVYNPVNTRVNEIIKITW